MEQDGLKGPPPNGSNETVTDGSKETVAKLNPLLLRPVIKVLMRKMRVHDLRDCMLVCSSWTNVAYLELVKIACLYLDYPETRQKLEGGAQDVWLQHICFNDGTRWKEMSGADAEAQRKSLESFWSHFISTFENVEWMRSLVVPWSFWRSRFQTDQILQAILSRSYRLEELQLCYDEDKELIPVDVQELPSKSFPEVQLPSLVRFKIWYPSLHDKEFSRACIHGLLNAGAQTLEQLWIQMAYLDQEGDMHDDPRIWRANAINSRLGQLGPRLPTLPCLRTLSLGFDQSEFAYDDIVQRCPNLEELDVFVTCDSLNSAFLPRRLSLPKLKKMYFGYPSYDEDFTQRFLQLHLEGARRTLEDLTLGPWPIHERAEGPPCALLVPSYQRDVVLANLKKLNISSGQLFLDWNRIHEVFPNLEDLDVSLDQVKIPKIDPKQYLKLKSMYLHHYYQLDFDDPGMDGLFKLVPNLTSLKISFTFTDHQLHAICQYLPHLKYFDLYGENSEFGYTGINGENDIDWNELVKAVASGECSAQELRCTPFFGDLKELEYLQVMDYLSTASVCLGIAECINLKKLDLICFDRGEGLDDIVLLFLGNNCPNLQHIIYCCNRRYMFGDEAVNAFKEKNPNCILEQK